MEVDDMSVNVINFDKCAASFKKFKLVHLEQDIVEIDDAIAGAFSFNS